MALDIGISTATVLTADGVVGTSGAETIVYAVTVKGGTATTRAQLYDGTDANGTAREDAIAPINDTIALAYPHGVHYGSGCYLDITTTGGSVTVAYNQ